MDPPPPRETARVSGTGVGDASSGTAGSTTAAKGGEPASSPAVAPSDQMRVKGSGRRKVALPPGRSQLDWVRNSRALPRRPLGTYTLAEVRKHSSKADAWMVVHGMVYDVTAYLEYHPGGIPMIMSGAGKDASKLFDKYHAWVNPSFMLERCRLGYFDDRGGADDEGDEDEESDGVEDEKDQPLDGGND